MAKSSLWSSFLEGSVEDMLPTAYVDAQTTKFYFCKFFLAAPIFACQETSEKILAERLLLTRNGSLMRDIPSVGMLVGLLRLFC